jgi:hypothetical protein
MLVLPRLKISALFRKIIIVNLLIICQLGSFCQEDSSWWKRLFKKETVNELEEVDKETKPILDENIEDTTAKVKLDSTEILPLRSPGQVTINTSPALDAFNAERTDNPVLISGYRIQVYHGSLKMAKEERAKFISRNKYSPCYLVSLSPNFAVRIGDYRSELEAHRDLALALKRYPKAYVVPDTIEPPAVLDTD